MNLLSCTPLLAMNQSSLDVQQSLLGRRTKSFLNEPLRHIRGCNYNVSTFRGAASSESYNEKIQTMHSIEMSSMIMQFELPPLECLFQKKCHPEYESVRDECDAWTLSLFEPPLLSHDPHHVSYLEGLYPLFTSLFFPSTPSRRRLMLLTKLINWLFILDDMLEKADSHTNIVDLIYGLESTLKSSLNNHSLVELKKTSGCLFSNQSSYEDVVFSMRTMRAMTFVDRFKHDVWEEMCDDMSQSFCVKFVAGLLSSLKSMQQHAHMQQKRKMGLEEGENLTLDDLMEMRLHDSLANLIGVMMEYALEIDMQDIIRHSRADLHDKVEALKRVAICHTTWTNDILSLRKELFKHDCLSIVVLLLKQRSISLNAMDEKISKNVQEVITEVWGMIKEQERRGAQLLEEIKNGTGFDLRAQDALTMYCEELCRSMAGNMYWSTLTSRYNGHHPIPWNTPTSLSIPYHSTSPTLDFLH